MLEAKMETAVVLKKLLDAIKELVTDANFDADEDGLKLEAMDNSHVSLVRVELKKNAFMNYRCDRPMPLGVNLASLGKVLKCAKDDDKLTLRASDNADTIMLTYEAARTERIAEYEMKLMDIDAEGLNVPDTEYNACVTLSSGEFGRICRDLSQLGESVRIEVSKEGVRFISEGESANGNVLLKNSAGKIEKVGTKTGKSSTKVKEEDASDTETKVKVKKEKDIDNDGDEDMEEDDGGDIKSAKKSKKKARVADSEEEESGNEDELEGSDNEEEEGSEEGGSKKRKRSANGASKKKKAKTEKSKNKSRDDDDDDDDGDSDHVIIEMNHAVNLTFSLKYLLNFSKSGSLCRRVTLKMSNDIPLLVEYDFKSGKIAYHLAPKIGDE